MSSYAHFQINRSQPRATINRGNYNKPNRSNGSTTRYQNKFHNQTRPPQHHQRSREFWCEPCDRDFRSQELLQEHKSEHRKCDIDGCKVTAHEKIIAKHIERQHDTGLFKRIQIDNEKWREARRNNFPKRENIEKRQKAQEERNKRGEKLDNSKAKFGRNSDRRRLPHKSADRSNIGDKNKEGKRRRRKPNKKVAVVDVVTRDDENDEKESDSNNGLPRFKGTSQMKDYKKRKEVQPNYARQK